MPEEWCDDCPIECKLSQHCTNKKTAKTHRSARIEFNQMKRKTSAYWNSVNITFRWIKNRWQIPVRCTHRIKYQALYTERGFVTSYILYVTTWARVTFTLRHTLSGCRKQIANSSQMSSTTQKQKQPDMRSTTHNCNGYFTFETSTTHDVSHHRN